MRSWKLDNAKDVQKEFPYTFYKPSEEIISKLKVGDIVKLIFSFESDEPNVPRAERMWVIIQSINSESYVGTLDNDPYHIKDIKAGDRVDFRKEHIIDFDTIEDLGIEDTNADIIESYFKKCFVSNQIMNEGFKVGRLYKEKPEDEDDTGWVLLSNYESQEYMDDSSNMQFIAIGKILNIDDSFIHLLNEPIDSEFERDAVTNSFYSINE